MPKRKRAAPWTTPAQLTEAEKWLNQLLAETAADAAALFAELDREAHSATAGVEAEAIGEKGKSNDERTKRTRA